MITSGTRKNTASQATPGRRSADAPTFSRARTAKGRATRGGAGASVPGGSTAAVPAVMRRRRPSSLPSRLEGVPALHVLLVVEPEVEQLDELVEQGDVRVHGRVGQDLRADVLHRCFVRAHVADVVRVGGADLGVEV